MTNKEITSTFNFRRFSGDVIIYSIGQIILLVFGFIQILIIARYLSVENYGYWQVFVLYSTYAGILHLGFADGILVRWAGKEINEIREDIAPAFKFLILEQIIVIGPLGILSYLLLSPPFQWITLMLLAYAFVINLTTYFLYIFQAIRRFKLLTVFNIARGAMFLIFIILIFTFSDLDYERVIIAFIIAFVAILIPFIVWLRKYLWKIRLDASTESKAGSFNLVNTFERKRWLNSLWIYGKENVNIGIFVLLGNFILALFLTIDRLMINSLFSIEQFAVYALALVVTGIIYTFIGAISQVFFPNLSAMTKTLRISAYRTVKSVVILSWAGILVLFFPIIILINSYLPNYVDSLPVIQILLCSVGFSGIIQILHVNYYKVYGKQRQYFIWGIIALIISFLLNFTAIKLFGTLESVAVATLISFGIWYIINELVLKSEVGESSRELWKGALTIFVYLAAFFISYRLFNSLITRLPVYLALFCLITWFFFRFEIKQLLILGNQLFRRVS